MKIEYLFSNKQIKRKRITFIVLCVMCMGAIMMLIEIVFKCRMYIYETLKEKSQYMDES
jgi:ATP/ADP translocase